MMRDSIILPCGSEAWWDYESSIGYRCGSCFAMHGSVGQPKQCQEAIQKWKNIEALGGQGWDYRTGKQRKAKECRPSKF